MWEPDWLWLRPVTSHLATDTTTCPDGSHTYQRFEFDFRLSNYYHILDCNQHRWYTGN